MKSINKPMDIIFIDGLNRDNSNLSFLGYLFPLAAEMEKYQYTFKILNLHTLHEYSLCALIEQLKCLKFKMIGMTTNAENIINIYKVCKVIKQYFPSVQIILGGPQVTYSDIETLTNSDCDIVVRNMGENSLIKVLDYVCHKKINLNSIKGISYKKNGNVICNEDDIFLDINSFSTPQYAILSDEKYWIVPQNGKYSDSFDSFLKKITSEFHYFLTGRGCPFKCAFCVEGNSKNKYVFRNIENLKNDLKYFLSVTKFKNIAFADDTFTSSPKRVYELCYMIKELQKELHYFSWFA